MSEDMSFHDEEEKEDDFTKKNIKPNDMNNTQTSKVSKSSKSSKTSSVKSKEKNDENSSKISGSKNSGSKKLKLKSSNQNSQNSNTNQTTPDQNVSTRTYLEQNVVSVVQEGMYELAKTRPDNPLEFLGNFILERAKNK